jgi:Tfp pilus assembly protein PilO
MKKLDARKFFWILIAMNVLLIGATLAVFTQASSAGEKKSQKIAQFKAEDQANDQLIGYYKVLQSTLNANKDLDSMVQKILPADKDQSAALADLDKFSKSNNVTIQQINFNPGTNKGTGKTLTSPSGINGVSVISVAVSCSSTPYDNLLKFLKTLETTQRRMQVTSLNITPNSTNPGVLDRVDMTIDIYLKDTAPKG